MSLPSDKPIPKAAYPCEICYDEHTWPPEDLLWHEGRSGWICDQCNCDLYENFATSWTLADEIERQEALRNTAGC